MKYLPIVYRIAVALWVGGGALFTFVLTPAIFRGFDRDRAGEVVGLLFPGYFMWGLGCGVVALGCLLLAGWRGKVAPIVIISLMLLFTSVQAFVIEPRAAQLKKEIPSFVTTPPDHPLRKEFGRLHGVSAAANLGVIGGGLALLILL